ncbi:MAG: 2-oxoacid:acceptor oxidoreductase family protein [Armatimonadota bacterium]|nr:2-oxoacid:acceptor oxidoreductase family protein [Armatimonadota bacterium]MDR7404638.1 2-oxoacid:acceptor oxidoreductase family protein [Armatimonadota bacterium]
MGVAIPRLDIRWHGRGGFGAKTAAALLAEWVIDMGGYGQAAPEFGPERRGAPVQAFTRIGPDPIRRRGPIERPDVLVVLDRGLLQAPATTAGVDARTWVLVNAPGAVEVPGAAAGRVVAVDASRIARQHLGRDIPNVPMLAAVVAVLLPALREPFVTWLPRRLAAEFREEVVAANLAAARQAMEEVAREHAGIVARP